MKYVYLDQNHWIGLRKRSEDDSIKVWIDQTVENGAIVLPFALTLLRETGKYRGEEERQAHLDYIFELSNAHTLRDYMPVGQLEIDRFVTWMDGYAYDIMSQVHGNGVAHLVGDLKIETEDGYEPDMEALREVEEELVEFIKSKQGFDLATNPDRMDAIYQDSEWEDELAEEVDEINAEWDEVFNDNSKRRRFAVYHHYYNNVIPPLVMALIDEMVYFTFWVYDFEKYVKQGDKAVDTFFQFFPSRYTYTALNNARNLQKSREARPNDIYDIYSLAVAIPYCDVVVTEKFWKTEARRANLNEIYGTTLISSLDDLPHVLS